MLECWLTWAWKQVISHTYILCLIRQFVAMITQAFVRGFPHLGISVHMLELEQLVHPTHCPLIFEIKLLINLARERRRHGRRREVTFEREERGANLISRAREKKGH